MKRRRVTIHDVAQATGLAVSTVSNALSGKHHVHAETRARVRASAEQLGYRASVIARSLRLKQTAMIGVLVSDVSNPTSPAFLRGIEDIAGRHGRNVLLCNTDGSEARQIAQMSALLDRQVDGMILISQHCTSPAIRALLERSPPYVLLQRRARGYTDSYVGCDNVSAMADIVAELVRLGHHRIGFIRGPAESSTAAERHDGFLRALRAHGLKRDAALIYRGDYSVACGHRAALHFLQLPQPPTAIIASNDMNALGVLDTAAECHIEVPDQLSVVGYDNVLFAGIHRISLTTIDLPQREMGAAAATLLMEQITSEAPPQPRTLIFPGRLICRGSTGPARMGRAVTHAAATPGRRTERQRETT